MSDKLLDLFYEDPDRVIRLLGDVRQFFKYLESKNLIGDIDSTDDIWYENELQDLLVYKQLYNSEDKLDYIRRFIKEHHFNDLKIEGDKIIWDIDTSDFIKYFDRDNRYILEKVFDDDYYEWFNYDYYDVVELVEELNEKNKDIFGKLIISELNNKITEEDIMENNIDLLEELLEIQGYPETLTIDEDNISQILSDKKTLKYLNKRYNDIFHPLHSAWENANNSAYESELTRNIWNEIEDKFGKAEIHNYNIKRDGKNHYRKGIRIDVTPNIVNLFMDYLGEWDHYQEIDYYGNFENMMEEYFENVDKLDFRTPDYPDFREVRDLYNEYVEL